VCTPECTVTCAPLHNSNVLVAISTLDERKQGKEKRREQCLGYVQ
jgi:hypothetical protein